MTDIKLEKLLAELPTVRAPAGWQDDVRAAIAAGTPPTEIRTHASHRTLWIAGGAALAAAAAIVIYFLIPPPAGPHSAKLEVAMQVVPNPSNVAVRGPRTTGPVVGDTIMIRAPGAAALRVYRNNMQIARCPGHTGCSRDADGLVLALPVTESGTHSVIAYTSALPDPPPSWQPSAGDFDADIARAMAMQIKYEASDFAIDAQPLHVP